MNMEGIVRICKTQASFYVTVTITTMKGRAEIWNRSFQFKRE